MQDVYKSDGSSRFEPQHNAKSRSPLEEYQRNVLMSDPKIMSCLNRVSWSVILGGSIFGIGAYYYSKSRGYLLAGRLMWTIAGLIGGPFFSIVITPAIMCTEDERRAVERSAQLFSFSRDKAKDNK
ncbi:uncharacterized protein LOC126325879 [Schistocerca gregaria]|uniref:uncharacterized protein LOC126325879 n=1 Tax=Schistocerca gregaria TaxID=7010 RepID=UPI00211EAA9F|nr:uncharacterized protein LOC126325879 [Schistocerca gregaria]